MVHNALNFVILLDTPNENKEMLHEPFIRSSSRCLKEVCGKTTQRKVQEI